MHWILHDFTTIPFISFCVPLELPNLQSKMSMSKCCGVHELQSVREAAKLNEPVQLS
jgi:hypothetical protein